MTLIYVYVLSYHITLCTDLIFQIFRACFPHSLSSHPAALRQWPPSVRRCSPWRGRSFCHLWLWLMMSSMINHDCEKWYISKNLSRNLYFHFHPQISLSWCNNYSFPPGNMSISPSAPPTSSGQSRRHKVKSKSSGSFPSKRSRTSGIWYCWWKKSCTSWGW